MFECQSCKKKLKSFYKDQDLGVHLNGDEAMALGAAFRAANISNAFRVRTVGMEDIYPFPIGIRLVDLISVPLPSTGDSSSDGEDKFWVKRATLFKKNSRLGTKKSVSFKHERDFSCTFRYDAPSELPLGTESHISKFNITGLEEFVASIKEKGLELGEPKVTLSYLLDASGIVSIVKVEATLEEELPLEPEVVEEKKSVEEGADEEDKPEKTEDKPEKTEDEKAKEEQEINEKKEEDLKPKIKVHRKVLKVQQAHLIHAPGMSILPMSMSDKAESVEMLKEMQRLDDIRIENAEAKNKLESYVYSSRDSLRTNKEAFLEAKVVSEDDVLSLETEINETEDWLYDEGESVGSLEYRTKLRSMQKNLDGMLYRLSEQTNRPAALLRIEKYAISTRSMLIDWVDTKPQVTETEREKVTKQLDELEAWVTEKMAAQDKLEAHDAPVFRSSEASIKLKDLKKLVQWLNKRPKPEAPKVQVNETETNTTSSGNDENNSTLTEETEEAGKTNDKASDPLEMKEEDKKTGNNVNIDEASEDVESEKKDDHSEL